MNKFIVNYIIKRQKTLQFIGWFFFVNGLLFCSIGFCYLKSILLSATLFQNSIANYSSTFGKLFIIFFTLVNYFSYMVLLAFIPALVVLVFALLCSHIKFIQLIAIVISSIGAILLLVDSYIYSLFKFHLNQMLLSLLLDSNSRDVIDLSSYELVIIAGEVLALIAFETILAWFVYNKIVLARRLLGGTLLFSLVFGGNLFSYFTLMLSMAHTNNLFSQQIPTLPLYSQLFQHLIPDRDARDILIKYSEHHFSQPLFANKILHYPLHPMQCETQDKPPNIILILVDSLRVDSLQTRYMPNLTAFSQTSWNFQHQISGGNATVPGIFSLFYSIPSNYWTAALAQQKSPVFIDLLQRNQYEMGIFWSAPITNPPFDKTVFANVNHYRREGAPGHDIGNRDRYITQQALAFLARKHPKRPFFLTLFYDAPHGYCRKQSYQSLFEPALKQCSRIALSNNIDPLPYFNRYLNAVHFVDNEMGKVLDSIKSNGYLDNSIIIFTADHGQAFNDYHQNDWGHAGNFTEAQVQVPFVIHWPQQKPKQISHLTSSYDLLPTLAEHVFHCKNATTDFSIGRPLLSKQHRNPYILVGSYMNMGIVEAERLTTLQTSGAVTVTTPRAEPLPYATPDKEVMHQALKWMRNYF